VIEAVDFDRTAAEFVLKRGGFVYLVGGLRVDDVKNLPAGPFKIVVVSIKVATPIADADLEHFRWLDALIDVRLAGTLTDAGIAKLAEFPAAANIYLLELFSPELTDAAMAVVAKFPSLTHLHLHSPKVTGGVLAHLKKTKITTLNLSRTKLTAADLPQLRDLSELTEFGVGGTSITDVGLKVVGGFGRLKVLNVPDCPNVTDAGIKHLAGLRNLTYLDIGWNAPDVCPLTSATFETIGKLTELNQLLASVGATADADLKFLNGLQKLETLSVNTTGLTDIGLEHLAQLKSLKNLSSLKGSKVTAAGVKKFRAALPACKVESDFPE